MVVLNSNNDKFSETINGNEKFIKETCVVISGNSLLNSINGKELSRDKRMNIQNFPVEATEKNLKKVGDLLKYTSDCLTVNAGTYD